jgi:hypothetical protein
MMTVWVFKHEMVCENSPGLQPWETPHIGPPCKGDRQLRRLCNKSRDREERLCRGQTRSAALSGQRGVFGLPRAKALGCSLKPLHG